jgi:hypothetical protein
VTGHTALRLDSMRLFSTWKAKALLRLLTSSKSIGRKSPYGCETGRKPGWRASWKDIGLDAPRRCPPLSDKNLPIFWTAVPLPMVSPLGYGRARWSPESLKRNFRLPTIPPMSHVSFMTLVSLSSAPRKRWQGLIRPYNHAGFGISIPTLKKSQERRGSGPLRRRSQLPARPYPLSDMGTGRCSAANPNHGTEEHAQDFRNNRVVRCQVPLPFSKSLQCRDIHWIPRKNCAMLLSPKSLFDSGQCIVPQRPGSMGLVFRSSEIYRSVQSSCVLSRAQCTGKDMASYAYQGHTQPVLCDPARAPFDFNFNLSKYSKKSVPGTRVFTALSITIFMSPYLYNCIYLVPL